ncbi:MAG TPA: YihY/virulence factor BrkB family protein, partial [Victivallales bacterium]|nr:YihY/virulence factor BrkB family protein [Victivallales bacterium]
IMLLWTVIKLLGNIEDSFNDIWGVKEGRTISRKFSDYLAIILICPILLAIAGSTTVFIASYLKKLINSLEFLGFTYYCFNFSIRTLPFFVTWLLFLFLYIFIPNTKVNSKAAIFASFVAGIFYQLLQFGYVNCQFALSKTNAVYGSLAALPFFLVWVQSSWLIVLFGAEIAFSVQNIETYEFEPDCLNASPLLKFAVALIVLSKIINDFEKGKEAPDENVLSHELEIPIRMVKDVIFECKRASLIVQTENSIASVKGYHPSYDSAKFTVSFIIEKFICNGVDSISDIKNEKIETAKDILRKILLKLKSSNEDIHVRHFYSS